jgi:hypothetical protein
MYDLPLFFTKMQVCIQCKNSAAKWQEKNNPNNVYCSDACQKYFYLIQGFDDHNERLFYHCTAIGNLKTIFEHGYLLTQSTRQNLRVKALAGEGTLGRRSVPGSMSLDPVWMQKNLVGDVEAEGVYFRLVPPRCIANSVALVFGAEILIPNNWNINTVENNGFYIARPGMSAEASWGDGGEGITFDSSNEQDYYNRVHDYPGRHELVVHTNVSLAHLKGILANPTQQEQIRRLGINANFLYFFDMGVHSSK